MTVTHAVIDRVLIASLFVGMALEIVIDVGSTGAAVIGLAATPILLLVLQRHAARAI